MATATATRADTRTDETIQREVLAELKWEARLQPNEIGVIVKDGVVTLTGWVDSYTKRWAAEDAAHRVRGVRAVANDIEVRLPHSSERTDADIAAAGQRVYTASCASCHGADMNGSGGIPPLKGPAFVANWRGRPMAELLAKVHTMPPGAANSLPDADYRAVTAWLLQTNALPTQ